MDITKLCFVCSKTLSAGKLRLIKIRGIRTLVSKSQSYNDSKWKLIETKTEINVHDCCYLRYSSGTFRISEADDSSRSGRSSRASSTDGFDFQSLCLLCRKSYVKVPGSKHVIQTESIRNKLMKTAERRKDDLGKSLISIITTVPLVDVQARYHDKCFNSFMYVSRESTSATSPDPRVENSLQLIYKYIENHEECQFSIKELRAAGRKELSKQTILKYLKHKYQEDITIITRPRRDTIICYSGSGSFPIDEFWYLHRAEKKEDELIRITRTVGELVRKEIKSESYDSKTYPSSVHFLDNVEQDIPKYLNILLSEIMLDKFTEEKENLKKSTGDSVNIESSEDEHITLKGM